MSTAREAASGSTAGTRRMWVVVDDRSVRVVLAAALRDAGYTVDGLDSAAAALRVDSGTIGGMDRAKYDEILGLDGTPYRSVVGVALGYRAKDDAYAREAKVRFPAGEVIDIRA